MINEERLRRIACQIVLDERLDSFIRAFSKDELLVGLEHTREFVLGKLQKSQILRKNSNIVTPDSDESAYITALRSVDMAIDRVKKMSSSRTSQHDFEVLSQNWFWEYQSGRSLHRDASKVNPFLESVERIKEDLKKYNFVPVMANDNNGIWSVWAYDVVYSLEDLQTKFPYRALGHLEDLKLWQWMAGVVILGNERAPEYAKECSPGKAFVEYDGDRAIVLNGELTNWFNLPGIEKEVAPERIEIV